MHPAAAPHLARVPRYVAGRTNDRPLLSLASNESVYGASPGARAAAAAAIEGVGRYPIDGAPALVAALAEHHGLDAAGLRITNGATEAISLLCRAFPGEVVVPAGSFLAYARAANAAGLPLRVVPRLGWDADLDAMADVAGPRTRLVFLANPDNPTGSSFAVERLAAWLDRLPGHVVVVIDEAYAEYLGDGPHALGLAHPNLVVLRSFSKVYGLAALRVGWLAATPDIADAIDRVRDPFNNNGPGVAAACAALADGAHMRRAAGRTIVERARLVAALQSRGFAPARSAANFVCVPVADSVAFANALAERAIAVRPLDTWGIPGAVRITVGTAADHVRLLVAIDGIAARAPGVDPSAAPKGVC